MYKCLPQIDNGLCTQYTVLLSERCVNFFARKSTYTCKTNTDITYTCILHFSNSLNRWYIEIKSSIFLFVKNRVDICLDEISFEIYIYLLTPKYLQRRKLNRRARLPVWKKLGGIFCKVGLYNTHILILVNIQCL